jgi:hypothetical protein
LYLSANQTVKPRLTESERVDKDQIVEQELVLELQFVSSEELVDPGQLGASVDLERDEAEEDQ